MRKQSLIGILTFAALVLMLTTIRFATASPDPDTIHPFAYGTRISYTEYPGEKIGCLTSGTTYKLKIDFYYTDTADNDQQITSLTLESSTDGGTTWNPVPGTITWSPSPPVDVPYSGKTGIGALVTTDPHTTVEVTFPVTGSLGQEFYYRVHFTSYKYGTGKPGNSGNHYFWFDICNNPSVPEFGETTIAVLTALLATFPYLYRRKIPPAKT